MTPRRLKREWTLTYDVRPDFTLNKERTKHHMVRAKVVKEWREAFRQLCQDNMVGQMNKVEIIVQPYVLNGRFRQDVAACFPVTKAAIDGLVDAGVLIDDHADIVVRLTFLAPKFGKDALSLTVTEVE